ncbi:MAG: hypothetical protein NDI61_09875 [Bdellovibrionaceae bacterium]|nr:hypothetical protein [Pseudobdellovibrionaceae bacterium]
MNSLGYIFAVIASILFYGTASWGLAVSDLVTQRLLQARSSQHVTSVAMDGDKLAEARIVCEAQLQSPNVPWACFYSLELERQADLVAEGRVTQMRATLNEACRERGRSEGSLVALERALVARHLSAECAKVLRDRLAEVRYMSTVRSPQDAFRSYRGVDDRPDF